MTVIPSGQSSSKNTTAVHRSHFPTMISRLSSLPNMRATFVTSMIGGSGISGMAPYGDEMIDFASLILPAMFAGKKRQS